MDGIVVLVLVAAGLILGGPIVAFVALARLRDLERRIASLEARPTVQPAAVTPAPMRAAALVEAPPVVAPVPLFEAAPEPPRIEPPAGSSTAGFDLEKLCQRLREEQSQSERRVVSRSPRRPNHRNGEAA